MDHNDLDLITDAVNGALNILDADEYEFVVLLRRMDEPVLLITTLDQHATTDILGHCHRLFEQANKSEAN